LAGDDYGLYRLKPQTAAYTVPAGFDPVKWDAIESDQHAERRTVQQSWLEGNFEIGDEIPEGGCAGKYVGEIIVPGGKYPSAEGGFRPAFDSGGTQQDAVRNVIGGFPLAGLCRGLPAFHNILINPTLPFTSLTGQPRLSRRGSRQLDLTTKGRER
jgi:hypothetical protein